MKKKKTKKKKSLSKLEYYLFTKIGRAKHTKVMQESAEEFTERQQKPLPLKIVKTWETEYAGRVVRLSALNRPLKLEEVDTHRNANCSLYMFCLGIAASQKDWLSFSCIQCPGFKDEKRTTSEA